MKKKRPFFYTVKFAFVVLLAAVLIFLISYAFSNILQSRNSSTSLPVFNKSDKVRFVIDPGHGGEDAGAVADDGTLEKDLNLEISTLLFSILELNGKEAVLTRDSDTLLYDKYGDLEDYTGKKKVYDLKNRLKIAEEKENSIYVGIHMNKFPDSKYSGLQVYFSPNIETSYELAKDIKDTVFKNLQPSNKRQVKRADGSIYVLHNAKIPAVLIECGFLSNESELELLKSDNYRRALAVNLFSAIVKYEC